MAKCRQVPRHADFWTSILEEFLLTKVNKREPGLANDHCGIANYWCYIARCEGLNSHQTTSLKTSIGSSMMACTADRQASRQTDGQTEQTL